MVEKNNLPDFNLNESQIPDISIKAIRFQNILAFKDYYLDLNNDNGKAKDFICFCGPNGTGKTTIIDCIQLIFSRFEGYQANRIENNLAQLIRHGADDFLLTAQLQCSLGNYEIQINKKGFIQGHPEIIKNIVYRLCFYTRFDQELNIFQLERSKWELFQELFSSVTGYNTTEVNTVFDQSDDPRQAEMLDKYVLSFQVYKPDETINHTECSAGERKVIKTFSTLLNKEYIPRIILIDNVEMHVEAGRHLNLINAMKRCFPKSQIFATTHSYQISRNFSDRSQIYDLRLIKSPLFVKEEPWRLYLADEIKDAISKIKSVNGKEKKIEKEEEFKYKEKLIEKGEEFRYNLLSEPSFKNFTLVENFLKEIISIFMKDVVEYKK